MGFAHMGLAHMGQSPYNHKSARLKREVNNCCGRTWQLFADLIRRNAAICIGFICLHWFHWLKIGFIGFIGLHGLHWFHWFRWFHWMHWFDWLHRFALVSRLRHRHILRLYRNPTLYRHPIYTSIYPTYKSIRLFMCRSYPCTDGADVVAVFLVLGPHSALAVGEIAYRCRRGRACSILCGY